MKTSPAIYRREKTLFFSSVPSLSLFSLTLSHTMASSLSPSSRVSCLALFLLLSSTAAFASEEVSGSAPEHVLTLDHSNFSEVVEKHSFIVVEFYAPWCGHCKKLEPEYEKAAAELSKLDPPIVLAKVDASEDANRDLATKYEIGGFPTLKIIRNKGKGIQEYKGPREADGIVDYLKKQQGPASVEIKSAEDAGNIIDTRKIFIIGVFSEFSGQEFENFIAAAEKLRADYDFAHTLEPKFLPKGESTVKKPFIRLLKPFDELFVDSQDFDLDAIEKFIEKSSIPVVTVFNKDPTNHPFVIKFFNSPNAKAMLFLNFSLGNFEEFKTKYQDVAENYKEKGISCLLGDIDSSQGAFQYFGVKEDQAPLIIIQANEGSQKYLKPNVQPSQIAAWFKEYMDGSLKPFVKSEPIPEVNNEPVKVVVHDSLQNMVFKSKKNVLLEFYAPWCGHCKKLAPTLEEVAVSFEKDPTVVIAKMDATVNDIPNGFDVKGYPTLYFISSTGNVSQYEGDRSKEDIIKYINKNKDGAGVQPEVQSDNLKDEL